MKTHSRMPLRNISGLVFSMLIIFSSGCKNNKKLVGIDPEFSRYIEAYTSGVISKKNTIRIQFTSDVTTTHTLNETLSEELFDFSPSVNGKAYWIDERTIEFKPDRDLEPNKLYEINFKLAKVRKVPSKFKTFIFNIQVIKPSFSVEENGLRAVNGSKDEMTLSGTVLTADVEESAEIEKVLSASCPGTNS